uniref:Uncharacterized protein n=2 Tax=Timema TaxID=61471 RepID=A0A7R9NX32_9NEOP|nr:unnamed protein product [Timema tahoe]CAD7585650.1 unnamed protein product [Timema genevievae]
MKTLCVLVALIVVASAAEFIPVLQRSEVRDEVGHYESADGTRVSEQGILKPNADGTDNVLVKQGSFSYISPEGQPISLSYIADELGFRPKGDHLPVAPTV